MEEKETAQLPVSPQETQVQPASFLDKLKIHKFKILGGVLGIFVFTGAVFGAYKFGQRQIQPAPQPIPTPGLVATPTPDETANWKTYTNTKYGYWIKYPNDWILAAPEACIPSCPEAADNMSSIRPLESKYPEGYFSITSWIGTTTEPQDAEAMKARARLWSWKASSEEQITVDGSIAWVISGEMDFTDEKTYFRRYIIVEHDGAVYEIDYWDTKTREYAQTFNLMLSTFRFLEESSQPRVSVPQPVGLARQDLAERLGLSTSSVEILEIEEALWPDTCLGLPAPELCARGETPGYRVTMMALGQKYTYHTDTSESFRYAGPGDTPQRP